MEHKTSRCVAPPSLLSTYLQYLYFLRFSILLWLLLPILAFLDWKGITTSFTRGIFALESFQQVFWAAFCVVSTNIVVLITTRIVCTNGPDRFGVDAPLFLVKRFAREKGSEEKSPEGKLPDGDTKIEDRKIRNRALGTLALTQIPTAVLLYVGKATVEEHAVGWLWFAVFSVLGIVASLLFWYVTSLFYYWTYTATLYEKKDPSYIERFSNKAMPLIFPPNWFGALEESARPWFARWFNTVRLRSRVSHPGYAAGPGGPLWELHFFSAVALWGFLLLYLTLMPINAPVTLPRGMSILLLFAVLPSGLLLIGTILTPSPQKSDKSYRSVLYSKIVFTAVTATVVVGWFCYWLASRQLRIPRGMPTLASILVLCMLLTWFLASLAFFLDRFRVPVLITALVLVFALKLLPLRTQEHYFSAIPIALTNPPRSAPKPAQIWKQNLEKPGPLVIVTATGGGIHAAAWTAEVLAALERQFAADATLRDRGYTLHNHVLLASGVSGGSVGLTSYLREYTGPSPFYTDPKGNDVHGRMTGAANCSSLEAVLWGLEYYDFANILLSILPYPATGTDFVGHAPIGYDRSWALEQAFSGNQTDGHCGTSDRLVVSGMEVAQTMTLSRSVDLLLQGKLPAYTLNTTAAETGDRFLLSNYQIPATYEAKDEAKNRTKGELKHDLKSDVLPAESFLHVFGERATDGASAFQHQYADLSLATAARLSATFPYVSSASRVPRTVAAHSFHFVDGGYFDNDGTSSVIEFLMHALSPGEVGSTEQQSSDAVARKEAKKPVPIASRHGRAIEASQQERSDTSANETKKPTPILLIEIRDSWDLDPANNDDRFARQNPNDESTVHPWRALQQLAAPPAALWRAGHTSVTRRNRRELCLLEQAFPNDISIHHLVFDYENPEGDYQPLNWHLTTRQQHLIRCAAQNDQEKVKDKFCQEVGKNEFREKARIKINTQLADAAAWTKKALDPEFEPKNVDQVCEVVSPVVELNPPQKQH